MTLPILGFAAVLCAIYLRFAVAIDCNRKRKANKIK